MLSFRRHMLAAAPETRVLLMWAYVPGGRATVGFERAEVVDAKPVGPTELMLAIEEGLAERVRTVR